MTLQLISCNIGIVKGEGILDSGAGRLPRTRGRKYFYRKKIYVFSEEDILNYKKDTNCEEFHELDLLLD